MLDDGARRIIRSAVGHDKDLRKDTERADDGRDPHKEKGRAQTRQGYMSKERPIACAVNFGGVIRYYSAAAAKFLHCRVQSVHALRVEIFEKKMARYVNRVIRRRQIYRMSPSLLSPAIEETERPHCRMDICFFLNIYLYILFYRNSSYC